MDRKLTMHTGSPAGTARHGWSMAWGPGGLYIASRGRVIHLHDKGDGTADYFMTFSGTVSAINTALNGLTYTPDANANGGGGVPYPMSRRRRRCHRPARRSQRAKLGV